MSYSIIDARRTSSKGCKISSYSRTEHFVQCQANFSNKFKVLYLATQKQLQYCDMETVVDTVVGRLEKASQVHEGKVVIDLGVDRIIQYIAIFGIGFLKIAEIIFAVIGKLREK